MQALLNFIGTFGKMSGYKILKNTLKLCELCWREKKLTIKSLFRPFENFTYSKMVVELMLKVSLYISLISRLNVLEILDILPTFSYLSISVALPQTLMYYAIKQCKEKASELELSAFTVVLVRYSSKLQL